MRYSQNDFLEDLLLTCLSNEIGIITTLKAYILSKTVDFPNEHCHIVNFIDCTILVCTCITLSCLIEYLMS